MTGKQVEIEIRPFASRDLDRIVDLSLRAWAPVFSSVKASFDPELYEYFYPDWQAHQEKDVRRTCSSPDNKTWVATSDDRPVAFAAIRLSVEDKTGEIFMIAVDPDFQRRGISRRLIDFVTSQMKAAGMEMCMLSTGADPGHEPARLAYERSGFKPWHSIIYFKKLLDD